mmetsp:Transcript_24275/g.43071  ORF Transcript_24275/g.43071 Transcript_24275/m.43071 type:complete len:156 (+) Transcript_24275:89-556(+)
MGCNSGKASAPKPAADAAKGEVHFEQVDSFKYASLLIATMDSEKKTRENLDLFASTSARKNWLLNSETEPAVTDTAAQLAEVLVSRPEANKAETDKFDIEDVKCKHDAERTAGQNEQPKVDAAQFQEGRGTDAVALKAPVTDAAAVRKRRGGCCC